MAFINKINGRSVGLLLGFLCAIWLAPPCALRVLRAAPPVAQSDRPFKMRVDVELVTAEVVVLDKKGNPVRDLKKESFRLYEDGKQQEIISFDEVNGEPGQLQDTGITGGEGDLRRGKTVMIVFDDRTIPHSHIKSTRDAAEQYVSDHMEPQDLFAVAVNHMSFEILQNFTDDPQKILDAIRRKAIPASIPSSDKVRLEQTGLSLIRTLDALSQSVERIRGRKCILLFSQNIALNPSSENERTYQKVINAARRANAIFYTIEPAAMEYKSTVDAATPVTAEGTEQNEIFAPPKSDSTDQQDRLRPLAADTGGFSICNTNDLSSALEELDAQLSSYYVLGFQSNNPKRDGSFRRLEVKTDLKDLTLKYKKGYVDMRPLDTLARSKQEKSLFDAMASPATSVQLPLSFRALYFYDSPRMAKVLVSAKIRMGKAMFKKKGNQLSCNLNVMGVAYSENDTVAARFSETVSVTGNKENEANLRDKIIYHNYLMLKPGKYRLKLAAADDANNLGAMEQPLEIPAIPENGFAGSSLVMVEGTSPLPPLIESLNTQLLDESDPLVLSGLQVTSSIENRLSVKSQIAVLFKLYNPSGDLENWEAEAKAKLLKDGNEAQSLPPLTLEQDFSRFGSSGATFGLNLPFQNVTPGKYRLVIEITEAASSRTTVVQSDLEFTAQ